MGTREVATEIRMVQWAQVMRERAASGLSIEAYCKANGIARYSYFYWQKKLREAAVCQMSGGAQPEQQTLVPTGWAAVNAAEEAAPEQAGSLTLHQDGLTLRVGGAEIEVRAGYDEVLLAPVIKTLSQSC